MEYELEYLNWKKRQLVLQQRYADTPPGLTAERAREEEKRQLLARKEYEEQRSFCLTSGARMPDEPFIGRSRELKRLRRLFADGAGTVFLSGMGGIGKSALARNYAKLCGGG